MTDAIAAETLPAEWYSGVARWQAERRGIFNHSWMFLTHESQLCEPGQWVAQTLAGYPILAVRGEDGVLRAFHNVCRHRAGPLTDAPSGRCADGGFTCKYHGWRYASDGRLRNARDFGKAADFDPRDLALFPVSIAVWRGLVFVALSDQAGALDDLLAPLAVRLGARSFADLHIATARHHDLACNWKTYVENYLEGYHISNMHPSLDAEIDSAAYRTDLDGRVALFDVPPKAAEGVYDGLFAWIWPNWAINVYRTGLMIERMSPIGSEHTRLDYLYLMPAGVRVADDTIAMSDIVTAEDKWIVERVQENLTAGIYATGRLSPKHEIAVAAFQSWVREAG
ncbi:MAG: aromatic ring-hydroxylating oxygenase subunit alpha [Caulobacterales bacterium]|jgi:choline monooxygenase